MTEADFAKIEEALSLRLPPEYRQAVAPFPVRAFIGNTDTHLWDQAEALIELNRDLRRGSAWPAHLFAIGAMDDGTKMAIDVNSPEVAVWWIDRAYDAPGTAPEPGGFTAWSAEYLRQLRSGEFMDGFDPENDPPGTRAQNEPMKLRHWLGCIGAIVGIAVAAAILIAILK
jgi:hypothetical protein